tara:strand:+ start:30 stop:977 length:948 start_codon:yes stop_codon:yes gene_type:complete
MCGIAGRILPRPGKVGEDLVKLMHAQRHRGADSTGFALYGEPLDTGYIVRAMVAGRHELSQVLELFLDLLRAHGSDFLADPSWDDASTEHVSVRMVIREPKSLDDWIRQVDEHADRIEVQSVGRSLEIVKDLGGATEVAEKHRVHDFIGTHGLGHARMATESEVSPTASHPFWARPFADVAIVHNGQITDYFTWRARLERRGYRFMTGNDSELLAVWISDRMSQGESQDDALIRSLTEIDGVFTFLYSNLDRLGFAKDRWAIKPLVAVIGDESLSIATEEQAVRTVHLDEVDVVNFDGPSLTRTWQTNVTLDRAA